jgi:hypothetical protein
VRNKKSLSEFLEGPKKSQSVEKPGADLETGKRELSCAEIERLPEEAFKSLPEADKERFYRWMDQREFPSEYEFYDYHNDLPSFEDAEDLDLDGESRPEIRDFPRTGELRGGNHVLRRFYDDEEPPWSERVQRWSLSRETEKGERVVVMDGFGHDLRAIRQSVQERFAAMRLQDELSEVSEQTRDAYWALVKGLEPSPEAKRDFAIDTRDHLEALKWAVREEHVTPTQLATARGRSNKLQELITHSNPYHGVKFETVWDTLPKSTYQIWYEGKTHAVDVEATDLRDVPELLNAPPDRWQDKPGVTTHAVELRPIAIGDVIVEPTLDAWEVQEEAFMLTHPPKAIAERIAREGIKTQLHPQNPPETQEPLLTDLRNPTGKKSDISAQQELTPKLSR